MNTFSRWPAVAAALALSLPVVFASTEVLAAPSSNDDVGANESASSPLLSPLASSSSEAPVDGAVHGQPAAWGPTHPLAFGASTLFRASDGYGMPGFGGYIRLRPFHWMRLELFEDNFLALGTGNVSRHDHEVGGTLQIPVIETGRLLVYPSFGFCAMLAVLSPKGDAPSVDDIRFGIHTGAGAEIALGGGFSAELELEAIGYAGHELTAYDWTASVSHDLSYTFAGQARTGLSYWF